LARLRRYFRKRLFPELPAFCHQIGYDNWVQFFAPFFGSIRRARIVVTMKSAESRFERELEVFGNQVEEATQFFFAYLAVHAAAYEKEEVHALLNTAPLFWNTCMGALQTATFIALGRVFERK
jgi:hypothetical protein